MSQTHLRLLSQPFGRVILATAAALAACRSDPAGPPEPDHGQALPELAVGAQAVASTWFNGLNQPSPRLELVAATAGGRIYAIGGRNDHFGVFSTVEVYNVSFGSITGIPLGSWTAKAPLPAPRAGASGAIVINGKIYVPGGTAVWKRPDLSEKTLFAYDVAANSWATLAPLPVKTCCGASGVINGKLYVMTPAFLNGQPLLHGYNPATNRWTRLANPPHDHSRPAAGVINDKFYVVGGEDGSFGPSRILDVYNPATNTWVTRRPAPTKRYAAAGRAMNGKLYVVGGRQAADVPLNILEVYDPVANTWTTQAPMPTARYHLAATQLNGYLFAIGGWRPVPYDFRGLGTNEAYKP